MGLQSIFLYPQTPGFLPTYLGGSAVPNNLVMVDDPASFPLTVAMVETSAGSLSSRATAAIDTLEQRKGLFGYWAGTNTTISSVQGALRMIRDVQIPQWRNTGLSIAENQDADRLPAWKAAGDEFAKAISEIDGYGQDAALTGLGDVAAISLSSKNVEQLTKEGAGDFWKGLASNLSIPTPILIGAAAAVGLVVLSMLVRRP